MSARFQEMYRLDCRRYVGPISGDISARLQEIFTLDYRRYVGPISGGSGDTSVRFLEICTVKPRYNAGRGRKNFEAKNRVIARSAL